MSLRSSFRLEGVPIERFFALLGHSRHYYVVQARQAQVESDFVRAWWNDRIVGPVLVVARGPRVPTATRFRFRFERWY